MASRGEHSWFSMCVKLGLSAYMVAFGSRQLTQALGFREVEPNRNSDSGLSCPNSLDCGGYDKFLELWESEWVRWLSMILSTQVTRFARKRMIDNATKDEGLGGLGDVVESPAVDVIGTSLKAVVMTTSEFWGSLGVGVWEAMWTVKIVPWMITDYKNTEIMSLKPKEPKAEKVNKSSSPDTGVSNKTAAPVKKKPEPFVNEKQFQDKLRDDWEDRIHREDMRKRRKRARQNENMTGVVFDRGGVRAEIGVTRSGGDVKTVEMQVGPYDVRINVYDNDPNTAQVFADRDGKTNYGEMPLNKVGEWINDLD